MRLLNFLFALCSLSSLAYADNWLKNQQDPTWLSVQCDAWGEGMGGAMPVVASGVQGNNIWVECGDEGATGQRRHIIIEPGQGYNDETSQHVPDWFLHVSAQQQVVYVPDSKANGKRRPYLVPQNPTAHDKQAALSCGSPWFTEFSASNLVERHAVVTMAGHQAPLFFVECYDQIAEGGWEKRVNFHTIDQTGNGQTKDKVTSHRMGGYISHNGKYELVDLQGNGGKWLLAHEETISDFTHRIINAFTVADGKLAKVKSEALQGVDYFAYTPPKGKQQLIALGFKTNKTDLTPLARRYVPTGSNDKHDYGLQEQPLPAAAEWFPDFYAKLVTDNRLTKQAVKFMRHYKLKPSNADTLQTILEKRLLTAPSHTSDQILQAMRWPDNKRAVAYARQQLLKSELPKDRYRQQLGVLVDLVLLDGGNKPEDKKVIVQHFTNTYQRYMSSGDYNAKSDFATLLGRLATIAHPALQGWQKTLLSQGAGQRSQKIVIYELTDHAYFNPYLLGLLSSTSHYALGVEAIQRRADKHIWNKMSAEELAWWRRSLADYGWQKLLTQGDVKTRYNAYAIALHMGTEKMLAPNGVILKHLASERSASIVTRVIRDLGPFSKDKRRLPATVYFSYIDRFVADNKGRLTTRELRKLFDNLHTGVARTCLPQAYIDVLQHHLVAHHGKLYAQWLTYCKNLADPAWQPVVAAYLAAVEKKVLSINQALPVIAKLDFPASRVWVNSIVQQANRSTLPNALKAAATLGNHKDFSVTELLLASWGKTESYKTRGLIVELLGKMGDKRSHQFLWQQLTPLTAKARTTHDKTALDALSEKPQPQTLAKLKARLAALEKASVKPWHASHKSDLQYAIYRAKRTP